MEGKYLPQPIAGFDETKRVEKLNHLVANAGGLLRGRVLWTGLALGDLLNSGVEDQNEELAEKSFTLARAVREFRYLETKLTRPAPSLITL